MENSVGKSGGTENSKKSRSLDIHSLYRTRVSQVGHSKKNRGVENNGDARKKEKRSRKEVSLSSFESARKKSRNSLVGDYVAGVSSGSRNSDDSQSGSGQKLNRNGELNNGSLNLDGSGSFISIPKRRRGFVPRKKFETGQVSKQSGLSRSKVGGSVDQNANGKHNNQISKTPRPSGTGADSVFDVVKLNGDSARNDGTLKVKRKTTFNDFNGNRNSRRNIARQVKEKDGHLDVNSGDSSSRKQQSNHRKRKDLALGSENVVENVEPSVDNMIKVSDDFQDEDEENLEQNAARMLSSRFDPSCTGFSSKSRSSASPSASGLSFLIPFSHDLDNQGADSLTGLESALADTASRVLRPRKQSKEKGGLSRKRRHFYEILSRDLDAYWVLHRRIKVFWPLDESWYYGLVSDYDPERELHHIKYDDRDEEWINLHNERFKLLLLPSEVPGREEPKRSDLGNEQADSRERDLNTDGDSYTGSYMDSEPIISWLARSSHRVKSPFGVLKKQKTAHLSPNSTPPLSDRVDDAHGCLDVGSSENDTNKSSGLLALPDRADDICRGEEFLLKCTTSLKNSTPPIVYFRRRLRRKGEGSGHFSEDNNAFGSPPENSLAPVNENYLDSKEYDCLLGHLNIDKQLWSVKNSQLLRLTVPLLESKGFDLRIPALSVLKYTVGAENFWLYRTILLLQCGTIMTTWPVVHLEMLFIDNIVGLKFLLFEGCLKQAVALVFLILTVFHQPNEQEKYVGLQFPATSIRFKLSFSEDVRKQHAFAFYCFSKPKQSKWLYLDHKLQRHCMLRRELPLSECTYDNIKALEGGCNALNISSVSGESSLFEGSRRKTARCIVPMGISRSVNTIQSSSSVNVKHGKLVPFALSFTAAPTFFLSLHLKLLMEHSVACISLHDHASMLSIEHFKHTGRQILDDSALAEDCSENASEVSPESNLAISPREATAFAKPQFGTDAISICNDGGQIKSCHSFEDGGLNIAGASVCSKYLGENAVDLVSELPKWGPNNLESENFDTLTQSLGPKDHASLGQSNSRCFSSLNGLRVEIPAFDQIEGPADGRANSARSSADLACNSSNGTICSPNSTGPRTMWHHNRNNASSSSCGDLSYVWPDGKADYMRNGFGNGPKKPRTQVQYAMPFGGLDYSPKNKVHNQKGVPFRRIRRANEHRLLDGSRSSQRNLELLACDANVLITHGDRGWRECGARVVLELAEHNEWKLAVELSGTTKYSYKATQFLQPGSSTNRYTHAMMWRGGKDWVLEFPDRGQWMLFKEMHEECYNRNIRAASVKNIPIPGVRLIEESDDNGTDIPFVRSSTMYFRQVETDAEMAMDPLRILYDVDSEDEQWILDRKSSLANEIKCEEISEDLFEKMMDMFEKVAHAKQCDQFTSDELKELMADVGSVEVIEVIHEHWQQKRRRKGMPLIRQLQPPLWERYQQLVKEWEQAMTKANTGLSTGCQERTLPIEKPPMFAFCLKPRGLEVPNRGSKQRSQRKFSGSGHGYAGLGDQDGLHAFGTNQESSDASPILQTSMRAFSPRRAGGSGYFSLKTDGSEWNLQPKLHRNKSRKIETFVSPNSPQMVASHNQRTIGKRNGAHRWTMGLPEWPSQSQKHYQPEGYQRHGIEQFDDSDIDEFRLRDASGAAQHALNMAKLKREKAQRLLYRADLAIHKAVVALMTAEAIKDSFEDSNIDG